MSNFTVDPDFLLQAADRWQELSDDHAHFFDVLDRAAALEMPPPDSVAGKAADGTPELVAASRSAVARVQGLLGVISTNLSDTATAYRQNEHEQVERTRGIWDELGHPGQFPVQDISDDIAQPNAPIVHHMPSVRADMGRALTPSLRSSDLSLAVLNFDFMWRRESMSVVGTILKAITGWSPDSMLEQLKPDIEVLAKMCDAFVILTHGYGELAVCHARDSRVTMQRWHGDSADMAMDYFLTVEEWYNARVIRIFNAVAQHYGTAAADLFTVAKQLGYWLEMFTGVFNDLVTAAQSVQAKDSAGVFLALMQMFVDAAGMMGKIGSTFLELVKVANLVASGTRRLLEDGVDTIELTLPSRIR
ncbi:hypothetical protein ACQBAR_08290 [Propionibacteriaceae bacterium Y1685]|uniref:hypothetical protein n=1 Tax=Microlunatus sp. Y1700 TaxID=3418487 RepID=UPI003B7D1221